MALGVAHTLSLEQPIGEDGAQLGDFMEDGDAIDPARVAEETGFADRLHKLVERLPEWERRVLALRYGLEDGVLDTSRRSASSSTSPGSESANSKSRRCAGTVIPPSGTKSPTSHETRSAGPLVG